MANDSASVEPIPSHCPDPASQALLGLWESNQKTKGGFGQAIEFRGDGIYVGSFGVIVDMFYRISDDQVLAGLTPEVRDLAATFRVEGDTMTETYADSSTVARTRFGRERSGSVPVGGTWRYRHPTGPMAFEWYTDDQRLLLRIPMRSESSCYAVSADTLTVSKPSGQKASLQFEIQEQTLSLMEAGEPVRMYTKSPAVWYDIQHLDVGPAASQTREAAGHVVQ
ncbi:MAG: hypothetical protein ABIS07_15620 [Dokdonella sp.]